MYDKKNHDLENNLICKNIFLAFGLLCPHPIPNSDQERLLTEENEQFWAMHLVHEAIECQFAERCLKLIYTKLWHNRHRSD